MPAKALVTGVAGFIGSHLAESLLDEGWQVVGVDSFTDYYAAGAKLANLKSLEGRDGFALEQVDLRSASLRPLLDGVDTIFHQSAQAGVRSSWASGFQNYIEQNIWVTQQLLESARTQGVRRFVYASSSSVYGGATSYPTREDALPRPHSPYGVSKLAGEQLARLYADNHGLHTVSLRYFTVYGPRQRPDMAFHRLIECALDQRPFEVFGTGTQVRDFTYVGDVVRANVLAAGADVPAGTVVNIAGGSSAALNDVVDLVGELVGAPVPVRFAEAQPGDVQRTGGDTTLAAGLLGWAPKVELREGLEHQVAWHRERR